MHYKVWQVKSTAKFFFQKFLYNKNLSESTDKLEEGTTDLVDDVMQELQGESIVDELISMSPVSISRQPSARRSMKRRASSNSIKRRSSATSISSRKKSIKGGTNTEVVEEDDDEDIEIVPLTKIMKVNSKEWPIIVFGVIGAAIQGCSTPLYAILFGEVLGV